jgi:hypothetical protein
MKFLSRWRKRIRHTSVRWFESCACPGACYAIKVPSLSSRLLLAQKTRELTHRYEFLKAGDVSDQLEASIAELAVNKMYLEWGLAAITDLEIDGLSATVDSVIESGPEGLCEEILQSIAAELALTESERKNF